MANAKTPQRYLLGLLALVIGAGVLFLWTRPNPAPPQKEAVTLFFSQSKGSDLVVSPVTRDFPMPMASVLIERRVKWSVQELLKGPTAAEKQKGFYSEIPAGTSVKKVYAKDGELVLEMNDAFSSGGGASSMTQRLLELQKTVDAVPGNTYPVHLYVNGRLADVLGSEGLEVSDPFVTGQ